MQKKTDLKHDARSTNLVTLQHNSRPALTRTIDLTLWHRARRIFRVNCLKILLPPFLGVNSI